ncbi:hypothetical protein B0H12DRAFT_1164359 [Mycena haematopus]|nr:hypothetical protein B0H12DRAFT_1164359 [Mycena haematopus]
MPYVGLYVDYMRTIRRLKKQRTRRQVQCIRKDRVAVLNSSLNCYTFGVITHFIGDVP